MYNSYRSLTSCILFLLLSVWVQAQTTTSATFSSGDISTDDDNTRATSVNSTCSGTLTVNVPAGRYVTAIDVDYDMEAVGPFNFISEQWSYIECTTTGIKSNQINSSGFFSSGVQSYNQTGLTIANGVVPTGGLQFELHAFRDFGFGGCSTADHRVNNNTWTVTVTHIAAPSCLPPTNLSVSNITVNSAELAWTTGGASNWQVEYGLAGFTPGTGTVVAATTNPFVLGGLNANTDYEVRVQDSCGLGDVSFWTTIESFTTACNVVSAPWSEDFENSQWVTPVLFGSLGDIDDCFNRNSSSNMTFVAGPGVFQPFNSGPSADHTTGSGQYLFSDQVAFGTFPVTARIRTPEIDLTTLTIPEMSFWYHMFGNNIGSLQIAVSNNGGSNWTTLNTITGQQQTAKTDAWREQIVNLSAYAGDTVIIRIRHVVSAFGNATDVAIDDLAIYEQPTCPKPSALVSTGSTTNDITFSWTSGGASNWELEYGPTGFTPGTGTIVAVTTNPFTLTGLSPDTDYDARVRDDCGSGDVSFWTPMGSFRTTCGILAAPWSENFDGSKWNAPGFGFGGIGSTDTCYSRNINNATTFVVGPPQFVTFNTGPNVDHTTGSGNFLFSDQIGFGTAPFTSRIRTQDIDLTALTVPEMSLWYHMFGTTIGDLEVAVSNNGGANFTNVFTLTGQQQTSKADAWEEAIVDLSAYAGDTVQVRIRHIQSTFGQVSELAIDDISIYEQPTCPKPTNFAFVSNTTNSITMDWTTGGATNWQIEYGPVGFTNGNGTIVSATTNPFTVTGLSPSTDYDFYVRDSCSTTDQSFWVGPVSMRTACGVVSAPYVEDFESNTWTKGIFFNDLGTLDTCWDRTPIGDLFFKVGPPAFVNASGAISDHTTGTASGKYIFSEMGGFTPNGDSAVVTSVLIDLGPLNVPELTFWYHMFGNDIEDLDVFVSDNGGNSFTNVFSQTGQQQVSSGAAWSEAVIDLTPYANDTIMLKFVVDQTGFGFNGNICIDDVDIHEAPTCAKPADLALASVWLDQASITWTPGGASDFNIEYGVSGFTLGSGTQINSTTPAATLTGLSANTGYDVYVRDSCGAGDVSTWVGPLRFKTLCTPTATPYMEDFNSSSFASGTFFNDTGSIDDCWRRDNLFDYVWKGAPPVFNPFFTGPNSDHSTGNANGKYAFTQPLGFGVSTPRTTNLYSVLVDVSSLTVPQLSYWYHMFGNDITSLEVFVSDDGLNWTSEQLYTGQQQTAKTDAWQEGIVDLSAYGDTVQIRFQADALGTGTASHISIDDVEIDEAPTCPKPQNFTVVGVTNSTVTLDWQPGGTATNWNIEYGLTGFTQGSGTILNTTTQPFTITGLSPNTGYEFYVRDSCGAGDVSVWIGSLIDTTDCNPVAAPWTEDFEGSAFTVGGFFSPGNIDGCWDRDPGSYVWTTGQNGTTTFNTGPSGDHTTGSGKFLYTETFFGVTQNTRTMVETQLIDLTTLTIPEFSFWYHMFGTDVDSLIVDVFDGTSWTREFSVTGQQQNADSDPWTEVIVDISAYANDTIKLRIIGTKLNTFGQQSDIAIDDLSIDEQPTCPRPSNLVATNVTANSITLSWTSGGANDWQIEYGPVGFTQGNGTIINTSTNPHVIPGLNSSTTYDFYVRDSCSTTDQSDWFGEVTVTTLCLPLLAPYTEDFEGSNFVPGVNFNDTGFIAQCWARQGANYLWTPGPPTFVIFGTGPSGDHTTGSGQYMYTDIQGFAPAPFTAELETPFIDLGSLVNPQLTFWYHMFGQDIGTLTVEVDNGSGYTNLVSFSGEQQISQTDAWKESISNLSAYVNDTIRLRFTADVNVFSFQTQIAIDDIEIDEAPSCPKPQALVSTGVTSSTVNLSWTTGGATNWQIEYGPVGFASGTGTVVNATTNPFTVTGLTPNTPYDFYVRDSCTTTDQSEWFGPISDTTDCNLFTAPYTENFDGTSWVPTSGFDAGVIDGCWDRSATTNFFWTTGQNGTGSFNTGPSADHTTGTGKFAFSEGFNGNSTTLTSPPIDVSPLTAPELRFWYHMFGNNITSLEVEVFDGSTWTLETTITGQQQTSNAAAWLERIVDLSSYVGDTVKVRFTSNAGNFGAQRDISIDDVWIGNSPTCAQPSGLTSTAQTNTSITLSWTTGGATNWQVRYRVAGTTGGYTIVPATTNPFVLNGLNPSTTYEIYVQDSCGAGDVSFWVGPLFEGTQCGLITAPWTESFDGGSWVSGTGFDNAGNQIDPCWARNTTIAQEWGTRTGGTSTFGTGPSGAFSGSKYIYRETSFGGSGTADITSPQVVIPASLNAPQLFFHYHMFGPTVTSLQVRISRNGGAYTNVYTKSGQQQTSETAPWILDSVDLAAYSGDTIRIRFRGINTGFQGDLAVDEISISGDNIPCADPTNLVTSNITSNTVDVSWNSTNPGLSQLNYYDIAVGPSGTTLVNVTSPQTISGLAANTTYVINVYDSCSVTSLSGELSDTITTIPCAPITADFTFNTNILTASFNSTSTNADSLLWNFDGTATSSLTSPSFTYATPGTYNVSLVAFSDCGNSDTIIKQVQVCDSLLGDFTFVRQGDTIVFDASASSGVTVYEWDLGDGNDTNDVQFDYVYANSGTYTVTLKVRNACGDSLEITKNVQLCLDPIADWTYTILSSGGSGMVVQFDASASLNATIYEWDFGDGNTNNTSAIPVHTYIVPSLLYQVSLTVRNDCGDSDVRQFRLNEISLDEFRVEEKVDVYPNPASDRTIIEWNNEVVDPELLEVYDISGKLLRQHNVSDVELSEGKLQMNVSDFSEGVYVLRLVGKTFDIHQEFIIQR